MVSKEIWKPIKDYEGFYEVSNLGRVRSVRRNKVMSGSIRKDGYVSYNLVRDGKVKSKLAHRIVAEAFIPNHQEKPEVNHIDGNKHNNNVKNLQWVTPSENQRHAIRIGLRKGSRLQNGGCVLLTEEINEKVISISNATGRRKWEVVDELLTKVLEMKSK
jgi:hypothetical protein